MFAMFLFGRDNKRRARVKHGGGGGTKGELYGIIKVIIARNFGLIRILEETKKFFGDRNCLLQVAESKSLVLGFGESLGETNGILDLPAIQAVLGQRTGIDLVA